MNKRNIATPCRDWLILMCNEVLRCDDINELRKIAQTFLDRIPDDKPQDDGYDYPEWSDEKRNGRSYRR